MPHQAWDRNAPYDRDSSTDGLRHGWRASDGTWHGQRLTHFYRGDLADLAVGPDGTAWVLTGFLGADLREIHGSTPSSRTVPVDFLRVAMGLDQGGRPTIVGSTWSGRMAEATLGTGGWTTRRLPGDYQMTPVGVVVEGGHIRVLVRREGSSGWMIPGQGWLVEGGPR